MKESVRGGWTRRRATVIHSELRLMNNKQHRKTNCLNFLFVDVKRRFRSMFSWRGLDIQLWGGKPRVKTPLPGALEADLTAH
ncbi:unnamed protein product [Pleuronectes platessa]|uniref:Uncharacterized protein n=1 Tax=Pleuronectes platessa TaxID=8262 RepID=A0A9N7YL05_PLEPL|nr:unnamed protein product [Pleuronectes platessa]